MSGGSTAATVLRAHRMAARLSQEELAERAQRSVRTIRHLESGSAKRPHPETLRSIAGALRLSAADEADFVASWREVDPDRFIADRAREDVIAQDFLAMLRRIEDVSAHFVHHVDASGRQQATTVRRTFRALESGVEIVPWLAGFEDDVADLSQVRLTDCVNMRLDRVVPLPATRAIAFVCHLGTPLAAGEARTVEYRVDQTGTYPSPHTSPADRESLIVPGPAMQQLSVELRFHPDRLPTRVLTVRRPMSDSGAAEVESEVPVSPFGIAAHVVRPVPGHLFGLRWEWPDERG